MIVQEATPTDLYERPLDVEIARFLGEGNLLHASVRSGAAATVLGPLSFDKKGDITSIAWAVYRWDKSGNYDQITSSSPSQ